MAASTITPNSAWKHQDEHALLLIGNKQTFGPILEKILIAAYAQMEKDGTLHRVFTGMTLDLSKFLALFEHRTVLVGLEKPSYSVIGFGWLWQIEGTGDATKANMGYCFWRSSWGSGAIRSLAKLAVDYWFNDLGVTVLWGSIVASNRLALRFCKNLGFTKVADIPYMFTSGGRFYDGMLVMQHKDNWNKRAETMSP